jgi:hypothetical protein
MRSGRQPKRGGAPAWGRRDLHNIKVDLKGIGCKRVDWIQMAVDGEKWRALVTTVINLRVP